MTTTYPTSIDTPVNPTAGAPRNNPSLAGLITNLQDSVVALETKVGADSSALNTSVDYKLSGVAAGDKAVSKTGIETLSNKTLTSPKLNVGSDATGDIYYRDASGNLVSLAAGASNTILSIDSSTGLPSWIPNPSAADASTSVKGVVEEATQAEVDAGTAAGGTGARLFINPSTLRSKKYNDYVIDAGSSTAYAIAPSPAITAYAIGQIFLFKAVNTNTTAAPTLAINGLTAKTIVNSDGTALQVGQITAGALCIVSYESSLDKFLLLSQNVKSLKQMAGGSTSTNSNGTFNIAHGLGVIPRFIKITANVTNNSGTVQPVSWGVYDAVTNSYVSFNTQSGAAENGTGKIINLTQSGGVTVSAVATFDGTNIILAMTNSSGLTVRILWEAIA